LDAQIHKNKHKWQEHKAEKIMEMFLNRFY
jgi:hypothetical protein